jgi:hypothetical protein
MYADNLEEDESTEPPQSPVLTRPSTVNTSDEEDLDDTDINASSSSVSTTHDQEPGIFPCTVMCYMIIISIISVPDHLYRPITDYS